MNAGIPASVKSFLVRVAFWYLRILGSMSVAIVIAAMVNPIDSPMEECLYPYVAHPMNVV